MIQIEFNIEGFEFNRESEKDKLAGRVSHDLLVDVIRQSLTRATSFSNFHHFAYSAYSKLAIKAATGSEPAKLRKLYHMPAKVAVREFIPAEQAMAIRQAENKICCIIKRNERDRPPKEIYKIAKQELQTLH